MRRLCSSLFVLLLVSTQGIESFASDADVLSPHTGHPLYGSFLTGTDREVFFRLDSGALVTLPWDNVVQLSLVQTRLLVQRKGVSSPMVVVNPTIQVSAGEVSFHGDGTSVSVARNELVSVSPQAAIPSTTTAPPNEVNWTIAISGKGNWIVGDQTQQIWGAAVTTRREQNKDAPGWRHQMSTLILDGTNSLTKQVGSSDTRIHEYDGVFSHAVYLNRSLYVNGGATGYHNSSLGLYLEQSYGGGLGGRMSFRQDQDELELSGSLLFIGEHFYGTTPSVGFAAASLTPRFSSKLWQLNGGWMQLVATASYLPAFNQPKAWQARGSAMLIVPINKLLSMNFNFSDNYMENAPRKNYSTSSVGLTFTFPVSTSDSSQPVYGACEISDPNGGPPYCVQLDNSTCSSNGGTYLGGSCSLQGPLIRSEQKP